jgi:N-acyl amino acid synthase of PEP-CTERM/exosortase system
MNRANHLGPARRAAAGLPLAPSQAGNIAFHESFELVLADTVELRDAAMGLRYEVYCEELGYEPTDAFPDGKERDGFDERSLHCLLRHRRTGSFAGCIRLVLHAGDEPFPFEAVCEASLRPDLNLPAEGRERFGEISRLAVNATFRRRGEKGVPYPRSDYEPYQPSDQERRVYPHLALGLYLGAAAAGLAHGLEGVFALMERRLCVRLRRLGIRFRQVGDAVEHRGERIPYFISREDFLKGLPDDFRPLLDTLRSQLSAANRPRRD